MQLERLYKTAKTGAIQIIDMEVVGATYTRTWGQLGGKQQSKSTVAVGKNIGRANETSPEEQAILEAKAIWVKKKKAGYSTSSKAPTTVTLPMKVKVFQDQIKNVIFPCISTPKLNGVNATYRLIEDKLVLTSRGGEVYPPIPHLEKEVRGVMGSLSTTELNGELYIHGEHLQDITSAVKKPRELSLSLTFNIFDLPLVMGDYEYRHNMMVETEIATSYNKYVFFLTGIECDDMTDIENHYNQCTEAGLEGTVIKNLNGLYVYNTRSASQFKYKKTRDAEFLVHSYSIDKNNHPVFEVFVDSLTKGRTFKVKIKGTDEERLTVAANADDCIGKWLKVEFETYSKGGVPLKPVGIVFRECDNEGNPVE